VLTFLLCSAVQEESQLLLAKLPTTTAAEKCQTFLDAGRPARRSCRVLDYRSMHNGTKRSRRSVSGMLPLVTLFS